MGGGGGDIRLYTTDKVGAGGCHKRHAQRTRWGRGGVTKDMHNGKRGGVTSKTNTTQKGVGRESHQRCTQRKKGWGGGGGGGDTFLSTQQKRWGKWAGDTEDMHNK